MTAITLAGFSIAGAFPGQPGNQVGFAGTPATQPLLWSTYAPGKTWPGVYPGSLTASSLNGNFVNGTVYSFLKFDTGTSGSVTHINTDCVFVGCYFGCSSGGASLSTPPMTLAAGVTAPCFYCTYGPSPSVVGGSFPPLPPGGGGYTSWPSATVAPTNNANDGGGYQYGPGSTGTALQAPIIQDHADIWACGNGCVFSHVTSTNFAIYNQCWYHDPRFTVPPGSGGDHQDGIGDVQSQANDTVTFVTINGCTVAILGNTQALAMQLQSTDTLHDVTVTNNFFAGFQNMLNFGFPNDLSEAPPTSVTNYVFSGNVIGPTPAASSQVVYKNNTTGFNQSGSGNKFRNNTFLAGTYPVIGTIPAGRFLWPDGTANVTDWTGAF